MMLSSKLVAKLKKFSNESEGEQICLPNRLCPMAKCFFVIYQTNQINLTFAASYDRSIGLSLGGSAQ